MDDALNRDHVHHDRETVVRRLPFVDVIVGMHRLVRAERLAGELIRAIGDHLVRVHVALRAGAGLKDDQRKLRIERAGNHFIRRARNQLGALRRDGAELAVGERRRFFQQPEPANDRTRPHESRDADREEVARPLRLRAPQTIGRDLDGAKGIVLGSIIGSISCPSVPQEHGGHCSENG